MVQPLFENVFIPKLILLEGKYLVLPLSSYATVTWNLYKFGLVEDKLRGNNKKGSNTLLGTISYSHLQQAREINRHFGHLETTKKTRSWQFFVTFLGLLSDPFHWLSDLQLGDEKVTLNHLVLEIAQRKKAGHGTRQVD